MIVRLVRSLLEWGDRRHCTPDSHYVDGSGSCRCGAMTVKGKGVSAVTTFHYVTTATGEQP